MGVAPIPSQVSTFAHLSTHSSIFTPASTGTHKQVSIIHPQVGYWHVKLHVTHENFGGRIVHPKRLEDGSSVVGDLNALLFVARFPVHQSLNHKTLEIVFRTQNKDVGESTLVTGQLCTSFSVSLRQKAFIVCVPA